MAKKKAAKKKVAKKVNKPFIEEVEKHEEPKKSRRQEILDEHGGLESNIPLNSEYWRI